MKEKIWINKEREIGEEEREREREREISLSVPRTTSSISKRLIMDHQSRRKEIKRGGKGKWREEERKR